MAVRPTPSLPRAFARASSAAENSPSSKADRRAQTARPDLSELSSLISAQGRSGAGRTAARRSAGVAGLLLKGAAGRQPVCLAAPYKGLLSPLDPVFSYWFRNGNIL